MLQILHFSIIILFLRLSSDISCLDATLILKDSDTIHSAGRQFTLGFFTPNGTNRRYLGIWYFVSAASITWVANRDTPLNDSRGTVSISSAGNLELSGGDGRVIWSSSAPTPSPPRNTTAQLLDSGNLVLEDAASGITLWESHRTPVDSFLPTMRVTHNPRTGKRVDLNSWRAFDDPGRGNFTAGLYAVGIPQVYIWRNGVRVWRSGPWNGRILTGVTGMYNAFVDGFSLGMEEDGTYYFTRNFRQSFLSRNFLNADGVLVEAAWDEEKKDWALSWNGPAHDCDFYNKCGPFALCNDQGLPICSCLRGYEPKNKVAWSNGNWTGGCVKNGVLQCEREGNATDKEREDGFTKVSFIKVPDFMQWMSGLETECESLCLRNCSCLAYAYDPGIGCMFWSGDLIDVQKFAGSAGSDFFVRVAYKDIDKKKSNKAVVKVIVSVVTSLVAASICLALAWWTCKRKGERRTSTYYNGGNSPSDLSEIAFRSDMDKIKIEELPLYSFEMLVTATNNFDSSNLIGKGGFGPVYKGNSAKGDEIAVKRLSAASGQGYEEFMNEVLVISKLQHRNLVRLLGCCAEKGEKMLIYEYMQNRSLDFFLYDKTVAVLDWRKRFNIIEGIGRGLLYLHRDSRLRIIHRDLKPSNVLLDKDWNPKISDFGMARIFGGNQDQANTGKVVGTYGYMAPEYAMGGRFSEKSDVFSFGVLVLEIISGKRNNSFYNEEFSLGLLGYAWKVWKEENVEGLIDTKISSPSLEGEIKRCLHIGLLCVQEFPTNRPIISTVLSMLSSEIVDLPEPDHPGFTDRWNCSSTQMLSANSITQTVVEGR